MFLIKKYNKKYKVMTKLNETGENQSKSSSTIFEELM